METIQPLPVRIVNRAKQLGIKSITLQFSGGSDEGYLDVDYDMPGDPGYDNDFSRMVEDWAWNVYAYSGAGDGSDYGDNITYDLVNNKASVQEWFTERSYGADEEIPLEIDNEDDDSKN